MTLTTSMISMILTNDANDVDNANAVSDAAADLMIRCSRIDLHHTGTICKTVSRLSLALIWSSSIVFYILCYSCPWISPRFLFVELYH